MGPKAKKAQKNAFSFFLDDYVEEQRVNGRCISHRIGAEECAQLWKEISEEKKQEYKNLEKIYKTNAKAEKKHKFTTLGLSLADVENDEDELYSKTVKADTEIKVTIQNLDTNSLKTHLFYIIHCNYYCKTEEETYIPGEMAIVEFSLGSGIRRTFHTLINPGSIPLGYAFEANTTIQTVHGLPYPPYPEGESDYSAIFRRVLQFLEPGKMSDGRYPPLYCIENNFSASENILKFISESCSEGSDFFRVFLLHKMFFWLKNKCVEHINEENVGFPVVANAEGEITKDMFCYAPGISCVFHMASEDKYQNCSLSVVQRYVYVICDHCCQYVGVTMVPGQHCRLNTDVDRKSNNEWRTKRRQRNGRKLSPTPSDATEGFYDGLSSYGGDLSNMSWSRGRDGACSFLHEELESKFDSVDVSSVISGSTRLTETSARMGGVRRRELNSDAKEFMKHVPLGRGSNRR